MKRMLVLAAGLAMTLNLAAQDYRSERPSEKNRLFTSESRKCVKHSIAVAT